MTDSEAMGHVYDAHGRLAMTEKQASIIANRINSAALARMRGADRVTLGLRPAPADWMTEDERNRLSVATTILAIYQRTTAQRRVIIKRSARLAGVFTGLDALTKENEMDMQDRNRLQGTPIPDKWTLNIGRHLRPLEIGMEVRFPSGDVYAVEKISSGGAVVSDVSEKQVTIGGRSFMAAAGRSIQISLYSEVEYRKAGYSIKRLDKATPAVVDSSLFGRNRSIDNQEDDMTVNATPLPKSAKTAKTAKPAKVKTATKAKTAKPKANAELQPCICGCGTDVARFFAPGHDARFKGWLIKIADGRLQPKDVLTPKLIRDLGPWKTKGDGQIPSKRYSDLRG